ncbi:hypothetical protein V6N13_025111 [Hibiscus sabdariffa]
MWKHFTLSSKMNQSTTYKKPEDMNYHSVCLHVLADSIRSYWWCLASDGTTKYFIFSLGQMLVVSHEDVIEVSQARFWELVHGHVVGSLSFHVKDMDDRHTLGYVHGL